MRTTLFLACFSAALAAGCHHGGRRCGCQQQSCVQGGNQSCAPDCNRGCCDRQPCAQPPCAPQANGQAPKECVPPAPPTANRDTAPVRPAQKPQPPTMREVQYTPPEANFGRAKDFSWLLGQLRHVHVNGGSWKLRYCPLDEQDKWGGSVILSEDARIDRFRDGDFVYVEGEVLATRPTVYLAGPLYRISTIRLATKADRQKAGAARLQRTAISK